MKTSSFLVSAATIVATAGAIGVAVAQTVVPPTPTTDPSVNVGGQGSTQATVDKGPAATTGAAGTVSPSTAASSTMSSDTSSAPMAQADRN